MKYVEDKYKTLMMDHVISELKELVSSIIVKQQYIADRYETLEYTRAADEYIAAYKKQDTFYSYFHYSIYALNKVGLYEREYVVDKTKIPEDKRDTLLEYQREYVLANFEEKNNYYRMLDGLPDYGDPGIKITEVISGVDNTKYLHEMDDKEINILIKNGIMDKLYNTYPDAKYLHHLLSTKKISIVDSRRALPFDIMYINRVSGNQIVTDKFITIYRNTKDYIMSRFYDTAYEYDSPYYQAFIGLFILTTSIQRYITQYFNTYVNRDFYDKDIIKLFFESYNIPFYNDIPLSYLQKIVKNLNRLLYIKATDKVFVNIFKIFGLDNVDIYNYILFKDRIMDTNDKPIEVYKEVKQLGYYVDTSVYEISDSGFYGTNKVDGSRNTKQITTLGDIEVFLTFSGILKFKCNSKVTIDNMTIDNMEFTSKDDSGFYTFKSSSDFIYMYSLKSSADKNDDMLVAFTNDKYYLFNYNKGGKVRFIETSILVDGEIISDFILRRDQKNPDNYAVVINTESDRGFLFLQGDYRNIFDNTLKYDKLTQVYKDWEYKICDLRLYDGSVIITNDGGEVKVFGNNKGDRLYFNSSINENRYINKVKSLENAIWGVKETLILDEGTIFILKNGTVYYTGKTDLDGATTKTDVESFGFVEGLSNVKSIKPLNDGVKNFYIIYYYDSHVDFINYNYNDRYGATIFRMDIENLTSKLNFLRDVSEIDAGYNKLYLIMYDTDDEILYAGDNENKNYPFIKSEKLMEIPNNYDMIDVVLFDDYVYYITSYGNLCRLSSKENYKFNYNTLEFRNFYKFEDALYITTSTDCVYRIRKGSSGKVIPTKITYNGLNKYIDKVISDGQFLSCSTEKGIEYYLVIDYADMSKNNYAITKVEYPDIYYDDSEIGIKIYKQNGIFKADITMKGTMSRFFKTIKNLKSCEKIAKTKDKFILDGYNVMYVDIEEFCNPDISEINAKLYKELDEKRIDSKIVNGEYIIYDNLGGIIINSNFKLKDKLDIYTSKEFISLFDDIDSYVEKIDFTDTDIIILKKKNKTITYEEDASQMYNLKFIEVPMQSTNLAEEFINSGNYLDYGNVIYDDKLWGGGDDKSELLEEILQSKFNYATSKYISISSRYNITTLNFELCYMFSMLTQLKDNEENLVLYVPYVGEIKLFDAIIGIFALTCRKFDFEGSIMETPTKTLYVYDEANKYWNITPVKQAVGFNFHQDLDYIRDVIKNATVNENSVHYNPPTTLTNEKDLEIEDPPAKFKNAGELINTYLNNKDILDKIYNAKYNATTIEDYNAYKRIINAVLYTDYSTNMYKRPDGTLPGTYMEYLQENCIKMYDYVENTTDENMIDQIDNVLVAIGNFLDSDRFKYIFLNIPTLSVDDIKKFITYLIYTFKSYTVELKAMNIIYDIDDKRINNVKLVLSEYFDKFLQEYADLDFYDTMDMYVQKYELPDDMDIDEMQEFLKSLPASEKLKILEKYIFIDNQINKDNLKMRYNDQFYNMNKSTQHNDKMSFKESYTFYRTEKK